MGQIQLEQAFESTRLEQTIALANEQLTSARQRSEQKKAAIIAAKKELREETAHKISGLWSMENFHELVELSQYANPVTDKLTTYEMEAKRILALEKMLDSPYFARIDFKFEGEDNSEHIYIGLSTLLDEQTGEMYVYDWRAPISSVFYRFGTGAVFYEAPGGKINGEVNLKRQYEIKQGKLDYFFDADLQIIDEFLRKLLSQNASAKMKTIVETIQKDQDLIIRDMEMDLLMVQGVAGSGKTSVALHRVAYLMYQGLSAKLSSNDIVVISPNTLFEQYIANVLPELGENSVTSLIFEEILSLVLGSKPIQTRNQFLEALLSSNKQNSMLMKKSMDFKGSSQFVEILRRFIKDLPHRLEFSDIYYDGKYVASRQLLQAKILKGNSKALLDFRLKQLENAILEAVHELREARLAKLKKIASGQAAHVFEVEEAARMYSIHESTALIKKIRQFTELDYLELYRKLFSNKSYFYRLAKGLELPACIEEILEYTAENLKTDYLPYEDALALVLLHFKTKGSTHFTGIKQVVIDEAQDYYPLHFEILDTLFSKARYTILGDINQTMGKHADLSLYDQISKIFAKPQNTLVTLDKSFRCTKEILKYSSRFLNQGVKINSFSRKGTSPAIFSAQNQAELANLITTEIMLCQEQGYQSIGLICKTEQAALCLYEQLKEQINLQLIRSDAHLDLKGVFCIPVYMAKGLEFDAVLICEADREHYHSEDDKNLLYIACTRALHRLNLFYAGEISPLL